ncbi:MAG: type VI secretion system baseplate subunit TssG [Phycisphaeraceae bacterium]|nr:type VI secretion system baseplate subunit TssG [Phycisphaeraceae bacterium]QYK48787.1 MAG: type VI secretion system baseplate subunit TssG [Phycisphaeraceae bacterium]
MAGDDRETTHDLIERLCQTPHAFDFLQAVRRLEAAHAERPRVGRSDRISEDPVRFGQEASLAFPPSTISRVVKPDGDHTVSSPRMLVHFMGLLGPNGPLPLHVTEYAHDRELNSRDQTLSRFLDIFNHRMISLMYRAWSVGHQAVSFDRPDEDPFGNYVLSLAGYGTPSLQDRDRVSDLAKQHFAGRLAIQTRNPEGLAAIISSYFGVRCSIEEYVGRWMDLPTDAVCVLGADPASGTLGKTCIVGSRTWDVLQSFRIRLGPMGLADYERFLPFGKSFGRLYDWVLNYSGREFCWDCRLILKREEVPAVRLGSSGRLGWTTWLNTNPPERDADDLVLKGMA